MTGEVGHPALRKLADVIDTPLLILRLDGHVVHATPAASELLALEPGELDELRLHDLTESEPEHVDELLKRWGGSAEPRPGSLELRDPLHERSRTFIGLGARLREPDVLVLRLRERDEVVAPFSDLSREVETRNLRQMKRRLEATVNELSQVNRALAEANAELDRYASVVSHDLKSPLATIAGFADLLLVEHRDDLDESGVESVTAIRSTTQRMQQVLEAMLSLARAPRPEDAEAAETLLKDALDDAVAQLSGVVRETGASVAADGLHRVAADATHVTQILQNLIANSIHFRAEDRRPRIEVSSRRTDSMVEVRVSDNGIGVDEDERDRIFEPLERGRNSVRRPGTGIGLATCRKIVVAYGGTIRVADDDSQGTTIVFTLPAA